jgi:transcription elongation factor GreB
MPVNYLTPEGFEKLRAELKLLLNEERPKVVKAVNEAAALGDRSENAEYIYGKRRLREIDRRIRFLQKRLDNVEIISESSVDNSTIRFGSYVLLESEGGTLRHLQIVGQDELDPGLGRITHSSPLGRALLGRREGDVVEFVRPSGPTHLTVLKVSRSPIDPS